MKKLSIIKIGGNILDDASALSDFLHEFSNLPGYKVLVHGGGKLATELSTKLGIKTQMVEGRRITDAETLKVTAMVYAGWINKNLVAQLQALGCNSIGLSGADGLVIPAEKRAVKDIDYGFVGDITTSQINTDFLMNVIEFGITPVICPITADTNGQLLNTNADTIASTLASALSEFYETTLVFCFEQKGVLLHKEKPNSVIHKIDAFRYEVLKSEKIISDGMIPKLDNAFKAKQDGVHTVSIGHAKNLMNLLKQEEHAGTYIDN